MIDFSHAMTKVVDIIHTAKSCITDVSGSAHKFNAQDWEDIGLKAYTALEKVYHLDGAAPLKMKKLIDDISQKIAPEFAKHEIADVLKDLPIFIYDMHDAAEGVYNDVVEARSDLQDNKTEMILDIVDEVVKQFCDAVHTQHVEL